MESQCRMILAHLQEGKTLTPLEALNRFGCFRLSGRIFDLRAAGFNIVTNKKEVTDKFGTKKVVAEYWLKGDSNDG